MFKVDLSFRIPQSVRELMALVDFVRKQDLGYPNYHYWVERMEAELKSGYKTALIAWDENIGMVGDLIFQTHKGASSLLEIKNMRTAPQFRDGGCANLMEKQVCKW